MIHHPKVSELQSRVESLSKKLAALIAGADGLIETQEDRGRGCSPVVQAMVAVRQAEKELDQLTSFTFVGGPLNGTRQLLGPHGPSTLPTPEQDGEYQFLCGRDMFVHTSIDIPATAEFACDQRALVELMRAQAGLMAAAVASGKSPNEVRHAEAKCANDDKLLGQTAEEISEGFLSPNEVRLSAELELTTATQSGGWFSALLWTLGILLFGVGGLCMAIGGVHVFISLFPEIFKTPPFAISNNELFNLGLNFFGVGFLQAVFGCWLMDD